MKRLPSQIIKAGLLTGTLDMLSAFTYYYIKTGQTHFTDVLKFIASGIWGKAAFAGGNGTIAAGLLLHYLIAFAFTLFFFWLYPKVTVLAKNRLLTGILYGIFVWIVMNEGVVPLSQVGPRPFVLTNAIVNVLILIVGIGLPLSFMASQTLFKQTKPLNRRA